MPAENITSPRDGDIVGKKFDQVCGNQNCAEGLALQGTTRANLLANWMKQNGIKLTQAFSSHKRRTALTAAPGGRDYRTAVSI
jgi:hypothetical protein